MTTENRGGDMPDWAREEREHDLAWIVENQSSFWPEARNQFAAQGRGVIVVDTTVQPDPNAGNPMYYIPEAVAEQTDDEEIKRQLSEYDPSREFVVMLLKPEGYASSYRVQVLRRVQRGRPRR